jgi:putative SOS response-associated peptidase YedK
MKWGWPLGAKLVINTRVETYQTSKFYRDALPCAVLCSGYYEWSKDHHKYYFSLADEAMYLASLYHMENNVPVFTIMTEPAVGRQLEIHNRQPIVLPYEKAQAWCASRNIPVQSYSLPDRICSEVSE